jgi:hypothetical protein
MRGREVVDDWAWVAREGTRNEAEDVAVKAEDDSTMKATRNTRRRGWRGAMG